jgi:hypothetical protein
VVMRRETRRGGGRGVGARRKACTLLTRESQRLEEAIDQRCDTNAAVHAQDDGGGEQGGFPGHPSTHAAVIVSPLSRVDHQRETVRSASRPVTRTAVATSNHFGRSR